ncbi:MAG TPA: long-chain fatty acid--CoA ligase, partial [Sphingomonadales bacterium]|nr:long-chain fatty acid--CoA ligase [Sphingomonadales bacterium]
IWFGAAGMGGVYHTVNPRLFPKQIAYIINHAGDRVLFFSLMFLPLVQGLRPHLKTVKHFVCLTDSSNMPKSGGEGLLCYEDLIAAEKGDLEWPSFDENTACGLCYTSGTTGNPKGVLYSHRSTVLHTMAVTQPDSFQMRSEWPVMPVVPMFHANAWGYPFAAAMAGSKLVLNGPFFDGATLHRLLKEENVKNATGVPTIWFGLLKYLKESGERLDMLEAIGVGGSAPPLSMIEAFEKTYKVPVHHAWGMTEMSPVGSLGSLNAETAAWPEDARLELKTKQGRGMFGVEMKIVRDDGSTAPWDGKTFGHLYVRGPWVARRYFGLKFDALDEEGWFDTGDVATIDPQGVMQITDRAKDVIKSGGEWISSIALENAAMGFEGVAEAAVIGLPHPKWNERPLLIVVMAEGKTLDKKALLAFLETKVAKFWVPDDVVAASEIPHTATGKVSKTELRESFKDHKWPANG